MLVRSTKGGEIVWRRKATLLCAKTKRSRHEQDMRHQPLSLARHLLRVISNRTAAFALMSPAIFTAEHSAIVPKIKASGKLHRNVIHSTIAMLPGLSKKSSCVRYAILPLST
jgi:hypothetical protein